MSEGNRYYVWPVADERTLTLAMLLLIGLFAMAVWLEFYRRRRDRTLRLKAEWRAVKEICDDRDLLPEDWKFLRAILGQYAPDRPYLAITKRGLFDECVARYIHATATGKEVSTFVARGIHLRDIRSRLGLDYVPFGQRIHTTRSLQVKQRLSAAPTSGAPPEWFQFVISDVNEATFSMVLLDRDAKPTFKAGDNLKFRLWRDEDARYLFETQLWTVNSEDEVWTLRHADAMTRNQSRAYFRLRIDQNATVAVLNASLKNDYEGIYEWPAVTEVRGRITSLSGGGIALAFQQPIPKQVLLRLAMSLPGQKETTTVIVRPIASQTQTGGRCLLRGMFVAMSDETRDVITRYALSKQKLPNSGEKADH